MAAAAVSWSGRVPASLGELAHLRDSLSEALQECGWREDEAFRVLVCADEAAANALTHGSASGDTIAAGFAVTPTRAKVVVVDRSVAGRVIPSVPVVPAESCEHGRGVVLMKALSDRLRVRGGRGRTLVAMEFDLPGTYGLRGAW